jgi:hypothetical protein
MTDDGLSRYNAFFGIDDKVYEVCVWFKGKEMVDMLLSEWLESGYFQDGDDEDNIYWKDEHFISVTSYFS